MIEFECRRCGRCCDRQLSMDDGKEFGMYLSPDEVGRFPEGTVFPLFRNGEDVFAYQLGVHRCPNLSEQDGQFSCRIYANRPLVCKAFPAGCSGDARLVTLSDRCPSVAPGMTYGEGFRAVREQIEQAKNSPQATEMFVLNGRKWIAL